MTVPAAIGLPGDQTSSDVAPPPLLPDAPPLPPSVRSLPDLAIPLLPPERTSHPAVSAPAKSIVLPTPDGGTVRIEDRPKVIGHGRSEIIIRRLAPEEKSSRRFWKNVILWTGCILLLLAACYFLAHRGSLLP
jgi:hypothetical protein